MRMTLKEIARLVEGKVEGDGNLVITGVSGIREAKKGDITFVANPRYSSFIKTTEGSAIIVSEEIKNSNKALIRTKNPYLAFTKVMGLLASEELSPPKGIHPTAVIAENVKLGKSVSIQPYVVIEKGAEIGNSTVIYSGCYIGHHTKIGNDTLIYPRVTIREKVAIGSRVIIHSGTVIGCDGFGFAPVKGVHHKVPQLGTVIIEDDVEIGANVTIDRGTIGETRIMKGTKIDNLVQIAHNVVVGENSIIVAQVGISGSAVIGNNVTLAGQSGVVGHIKIGDNVVVAGKAGVTKDIPKDACVSGFPAQPHDQEKKVRAYIQRLPKIYKNMREFERRIEALENGKLD